MLFLGKKRKLFKIFKKCLTYKTVNKREIALFKIYLFNKVKKSHI
jgi:hypothetical protein